MGCSRVHVWELLKPLVGEGRERFLKQEVLSVVRWPGGTCGHGVGDSDLLLTLVR